MKQIFTLYIISLLINVFSSLQAQSDFLAYSQYADLPPFTELADLDGDGDLDAFAGVETIFLTPFPFGTEEYLNKTEAVLIYENIGTTANPVFSAPVDFPLIFDLMSTYLPDIANSNFRLKDMDNDGDLDLFLANIEDNGAILYFKNSGTSTIPQFERDNTFDISNVGSFIVDFQLHDIDDDGAPDLILNTAFPYYDCNFLGCFIIEITSNLSIAKNTNGFTTLINIDDIYEGLSPCQSCYSYYKEIYSLGVRNFGNDTYITYQTNLKYDDDSLVIHMQNAKLSIDWINEEASIDLNSSTTLPYQHKGSISQADLNQDGITDFADHLYYLQSTNDPTIFNQIELNPFNLNPSIDSFGTTMQFFDSEVLGSDFNNQDLFAQIHPRTGLGFKSKIIDLNNNGKLDYVTIGSMGLLWYEDFESNSTPKHIFPIDFLSNLFSSDKSIVDFKLKDLNEDGLVDLIISKFVNINGTNAFEINIDFFELAENNGELDFLAASNLFTQSSVLAGFDESLLENSSLFAEDFNGDNLDDILMLLYDPTTNNTLVSFLANNGTLAQPQYTQPPVNTQIIGKELFQNSFYLSRNSSALDYDSDGDFDIIISEFDSINIVNQFLYKNNGTIENPFFDELIPINNLIQQHEQIVELTNIDYNNDGNQDLLLHKKEFASTFETYVNGISNYFVNLIVDDQIATNLWKENTLYINPNELPFLLTNEDKTINSDTIIIDFNHLNLSNAIDIDEVIPEKVFYTVTQNVEHGILVNVNTNTIDVKTFTQADIDNNFIQYSSNTPYTDDAFVFTVKYGAFELLSQTFNLNVEVISGVFNPSAISLDIYPNPVKDFIFIHQNDYSIESYQIVDLTGKVMLNSNTKPTNNSIFVKSLPKGLYILETTSNHQKAKTKFIKF